MPLHNSSCIYKEQKLKHKHDISISNGAIPFSVYISIDLQEYCISARIIHDLHEKVNIFHEENLAIELSKHQQLFASVKDDYCELLQGTIGCDYWYETLRNLRQQINDLIRCDSEKDLIKILDYDRLWNYFLKKTKGEHYVYQDIIKDAKILLPIINETLDDSDKSRPLIFESMQNDLIELIKNSVDAMIKAYKNHKSEKSFLQMKVQLIPDEDDMTISIEDNAGGVSDDVLREINSKLKLTEYPMRIINSDKLTEEAEYYTGGRGFGLARIFSLVINGKDISAGSIKNLYDVCGKTSAKFDNLYDINGLKLGSIISLTAPYEPFDLISETEEKEEEDKTARSIEALSSPLTLFSSTERRQKNQKQNIEDRSKYTITPEICAPITRVAY